MTEHRVRIEEFEQLAKECHYRVEEFAKKIGRSRRWVREIFCDRFNETPHAVFARWRAQEIEEALRHGKLGKELVGEYGLQHISSLTRALKRDAGHGIRTLVPKS